MSACLQEIQEQFEKADVPRGRHYWVLLPDGPMQWTCFKCRYTCATVLRPDPYMLVHDFAFGKHLHCDDYLLHKVMES